MFSRRPAAVAAAVASMIVFAATGCAGGANGGVSSPVPSSATGSMSAQRPSTSAAATTSSPEATPAAALEVWPSAAALATTERWLRRRTGITALAVIDSRGRLHGYRYDTQFGSASLVKAMLLVQYLRTHASLTSHESFLLARMIVGSDNAATDRVFARVGTGGLSALARVAGMERFTPSNVWALSMVTAADQACFFLHIDGLVPQGHRALLGRLLAERGRYRGWGIPQAALQRGWRVWWKDGWMHSARGELLLQAARLERGDTTLVVTVIADGQPTSGYGVATMLGVGERLLRRGGR
jgi:beta-lactamase class A